MRVCLYWNAKAGGAISLDRLTSIIEGAGHRVVRAVEDETELPSQMDDVDCVVAAGGDGTVARAGRALAGSSLPMAILPLGTANNIANSLAIRGELSDLVRRWHERNVAKIDVGMVSCGNGTDHFLESVGCGLVTSCIEVGQATLSKDDPDSHLEDARTLYLDTLRALRTERYQIVLDGDELTGEFLLVEVLNTPSIGPQLALTEDVSASDGFLSVVVIGESDRATLSGHLSALQRGAISAAGFKPWRVRNVAITGADRLHVDDRVIDAGGSIRIETRPLALSILA